MSHVPRLQQEVVSDTEKSQPAVSNMTYSHTSSCSQLSPLAGHVPFFLSVTTFFHFLLRLCPELWEHKILPVPKTLHRPLVSQHVPLLFLPTLCIWGVFFSSQRPYLSPPPMMMNLAHIALHMLLDPNSGGPSKLLMFPSRHIFKEHKNMLCPDWCLDSHVSFHIRTTTKSSILQRAN